MKLKEIKIVKIWMEAAELLKGEFSMPFNRMNGGRREGGVYLAKIDIDYSNISVQIHSGFDEFPFENDEYKEFDITITAKKETRETIELSIWRKDYLDKLFGFRNTKTGYKEFDKVIGLKASRNIRRDVPKVFESKELREELINERYRAYNIQTIDGKIIIERKTSLRINSSALIITEYQKFCLFLDGLLNSKIL